MPSKPVQRAPNTERNGEQECVKECVSTNLRSDIRYEIHGCCVGARA